MVGAAVTVKVTGTVTEVAPVAPERDLPAIGAGRQGAGRYAHGHGAVAGARGRCERQPGGVVDWRSSLGCRRRCC